MNTLKSPIALLTLISILALFSCKKDRKPAAQKSVSTTHPEIGLQLYSLRNEFKVDVPGTLAKIHEMGIREVEGGGTYGYSMDDFKSLLKDNDLSMVSVGADYQKLIDDPQSIIDNAHAFGARFVMCSWIPHPGDTFTIEQIKKAAEVFDNAGKIFLDSGISFNYHIHGYEFRPYKDGTLFDYLVENTDPRYVNFELDVFWAKQGGQDPALLMRKYPERFTMLHLKDREPGTPDSNDGRAPDETNVVLGQGDVGIADVMEVAGEIGIKYYFIEDESPRSVQQIPLSLEYLKHLN
jgi:sugar phosphate isomerase/epimerase